MGCTDCDQEKADNPAPLGLPSGVWDDLNIIAEAIRLRADGPSDELAQILRESRNVDVNPSDKVQAHTSILRPTGNGPFTAWVPLVQPSPDLIRSTIVVGPPIGTAASSMARVAFTADRSLLIPALDGTADISGIAVLTIAGGPTSSIYTPGPLVLPSTSGLWVSAAIQGDFSEADPAPILVASFHEYRDR